MARLPFHHRQSEIRIVVFLAATLVLALTILDRGMLETPEVDSFLLPGAVAGLLITGPHGGTHQENFAAIVVGFAINTAFYSMVGVLVFFTLRRVRKWQSKK